jgi:hypothetical protein
MYDCKTEIIYSNKFSLNKESPQNSQKRKLQKNKIQDY